MNFYILTIYDGETEIYAGIFSTYIRAREYAAYHAKRDVVFQPSPDFLDLWKDETETYYIDRVEEGYNIK